MCNRGHSECIQAQHPLSPNPPASHSPDMRCFFTLTHWGPRLIRVHSTRRAAMTRFQKMRLLWLETIMKACVKLGPDVCSAHSKYCLEQSPGLFSFYFFKQNRIDRISSVTRKIFWCFSALLLQMCDWAGSSHPPTVTTAALRSGWRRGRSSYVIGWKWWRCQPI